jgi:STE24 endopeptidase
MKQVLGFLLAACMLLGSARLSAAATAPGVAAAPAATSSVSAAPAAAAPFDVEAATNAYMNQLSPEARARSDAYFEGGYWLILWDLLVALGVAWLLLGTRLSARMRDGAERITRWRWLQTAIYAAEYIVLTTLLTLPWNIYEGFVREHQYGLATQNFAQWAGDQAKSLLIALILGTIALVVIYAVIRRTGRSWWLWGTGVALVFIVFLATLAPVYIAPMFNSYKSLPESPLKDQILSMARANGIPAHDVYWFDASRQSNRISANVSGMFGTTRISLNDNLLKRSTPSEVKAVLGHEMGHYVLNHVYKGLIFGGIVILLGFAFVAWGFGWAERRWGTRWGLRGVGDVAGLPLIAALFAIFMAVMTPVNNTITRTMEAEADAFGLNAARQPDGFAEAAVQLSEYRKMHPGPVEEFVFFDHPSGWNRIHRAMVWKAEHVGDADVQAAAASMKMPPKPFNH